MFLAYLAAMVALAFFLWLNRNGNTLVSILAAGCVLQAFRLRTE